MHDAIATKAQAHDLCFGTSCIRISFTILADEPHPLTKIHLGGRAAIHIAALGLCDDGGTACQGGQLKQNRDKARAIDADDLNMPHNVC